MKYIHAFNSIRHLLNRRQRVLLAYFRDRVVIIYSGIIRSFIFDVKCPEVFALRMYALHFHHDSSFHSIIAAASTPYCHHTPNASSVHPHKHWPPTPATCWEKQRTDRVELQNIAGEAPAVILTVDSHSEDGLVSRAASGFLVHLKWEVLEE